MSPSPHRRISRTEARSRKPLSHLHEYTQWLRPASASSASSLTHWHAPFRDFRTQPCATSPPRPAAAVIRRATTSPSQTAYFCKGFIIVITLQMTKPRTVARPTFS